MDRNVLTASRRTDFGKAAAARCRREGRMPAVICGRDGKSIAIEVPYRDFNKLFRVVTDSTLVVIKVDGGEEFEAFIKDYQYDIVTDTICHADFYAVERGKLLRTAIQIRLTGSPEACRQGAVLETGVTEIEVECLPRDLPERIVVDASKLAPNESIHVSDIEMPLEVKVLTDPSRAVAMLKFGKGAAGSGAEEDTESAVEA